MKLVEYGSASVLVVACDFVLPRLCAERVAITSGSDRKQLSDMNMYDSTTPVLMSCEVFGIDLDTK